MRELSIATCKAPLTLSDSEAAQPFDIFGCVVAPATRSAAGQGKRSEPLSEPEPALTYAKVFGGLADRERVSLKHAPKIELTDRFL